MRGRVFDMQRVGRAAAVLLVAVAILASAISFGFGGRAGRHGAVAAPAAGGVDAGLERCRGLGTAAAGDPQCQAVWAELRRRFFASSRPETGR